MDAWWVWLVVAAVLGVGEVLTTSLVAAMLAGGAIAAALTGALHGPLLLQVLAFVVVSVGLLGFVRPVAQRHLAQQPAETRTGVAALVGKQAMVLEPVDRNGGRVRLSGEVWSARSYDESSVIPVGATVDVVTIDGATAVVLSTEPLR